MNPDNVIVCSNKKGCNNGTDPMTSSVKKHLIGKAISGDHGGTLIIADTKAQVSKAIKALKSYREKNPNGKFILAVDEADAMLRTENKNQLFEKAYQKLVELGPSCQIMVSATPVPVMLECLRNEEKNVAFFLVVFFGQLPTSTSRKRFIRMT